MTEFLSQWTGHSACALQAALRLSHEAFARKLGVGKRTVASWHERPGLVQIPEMQQALDTTLERASPHVKARFAELVERPESSLPDVDESPASGPQALAVAIAIVVRHDFEVLIVCRRDSDGNGIAWQFPAGMVKPGASPESTAIRETLGETGVNCAVRENLGSRIHPITNVLCHYLLCEYLTGDADNVDVVENVSVAWAEKARLTRFIPADQIYEPILEALEVPDGQGHS